VLGNGNAFSQSKAGLDENDANIYIRLPSPFQNGNGRYAPMGIGSRVLYCTHNAVRIYLAFVVSVDPLSRHILNDPFEGVTTSKDRLTILRGVPPRNLPPCSLSRRREDGFVVIDAPGESR
jgi:hypothetical protein